jgi:hypothetical protein
MADDYANPGYIFWGNAPQGQMTYDQLQQRRAIATALMKRQSKFPKTFGEGLTYLGESIGDAAVLRQQQAAEAAAAARQQSAIEGFLKGYGGGGDEDTKTGTKAAAEAPAAAPAVQGEPPEAPARPPATAVASATAESPVAAPNTPDASITNATPVPPREVKTGDVTTSPIVPSDSRSLYAQQADPAANNRNAITAATMGPQRPPPVPGPAGQTGFGAQWNNRVAIPFAAQAMAQAPQTPAPVRVPPGAGGPPAAAVAPPPQVAGRAMPPPPAAQNISKAPAMPGAQYDAPAREILQEPSLRPGRQEMYARAQSMSPYLDPDTRKMFSDQANHLQQYREQQYQQYEERVLAERQKAVDLAKSRFQYGLETYTPGQPISGQPTPPGPAPAASGAVPPQGGAAPAPSQQTAQAPSVGDTSGLPWAYQQKGAEISRAQAEATKEQQAARVAQRFGSPETYNVMLQDITKDRNGVQQVAMGLPRIAEAKQSINGAITGTGAEARLDLLKAAHALGFAPDNNNVAEATEVLRSRLAAIAGAMIKSTVGSQNISDADRAFVEKAATGTIAMEPGSIRRLLDSTQDAAIKTINQHNDRLYGVFNDPVMDRGARTGARVDMPYAPEHVTRLKANPSSAAAFDKLYGKGHAAAVLSGVPYGE